MFFEHNFAFSINKTLSSPLNFNLETMTRNIILKFLISK